MLAFDILLKKGTVTDSKNNLILDLTNNSIKPTFINDTKIVKVVLVSDDFEMRPDLVAKATMGSTSYADILMKFNGISNPYSLASGTYIFVPDINSVVTTMIDQSKISVPLRNIVFNPDKLSNKDKARLLYLEEKAASYKNAGSALPPNFDPNGNSEVTVKDGKIIFGDNVSLPIDKCTLQPITVAQFKSKILAQQIKNNSK